VSQTLRHAVSLKTSVTHTKINKNKPKKTNKQTNKQTKTNKQKQTNKKQIKTTTKID